MKVPKVQSVERKETGYTNPKRSFLLSQLNQRENVSKWDELVKNTYGSSRFEVDYAFPTNMWGTWVKPKPQNPSRQKPKIVALDCEFCVTCDPATGVRHEKALVRCSLVDGEDPNRVLLDLIVNQPENKNHEIVNYKTELHGVQPEVIQNSTTTFRDVQKKLMKYIDQDTIIVGQSLFADLNAVRMVHHRVIDTAYIFTRKGAPNACPSLQDLAVNVLNLDMPDEHDSVLDAQVAMYAAAYAIKPNANLVVEPVRYKRDNHKVSSLRVHKITKGITEKALETYFMQEVHVVPLVIDCIVRTDRSGKEIQYGKTDIIFRSPEHANLAYETIEGSSKPDSAGRPQKSVEFPRGKAVIGKYSD